MNGDLPTRLQRYLSESERTPLTGAVRASDVEAVHFLLSQLSPEQKNAAVNQREKSWFRWTPLHLACAGKPNLEIIRLLIDAGADVEAQDGMEDTPLDKAIHYASIEAVQLLIQSGASVTPNALEEAESYGLSAIVALLEEHRENSQAASD